MAVQLLASNIATANALDLTEADHAVRSSKIVRPVSRHRSRGVLEMRRDSCSAAQ